MAGGLRIWIDLENTPHVLFFEPLIAALQARGHQVTVSARRFGNTLAVARARGAAVHVIGSGYDRGRSPLIKYAFFLLRRRQLQRFARQQRFDVAVSHVSRTQIGAAAVLGVPAWTSLDYEHVDLRNLHLVRCLMVPEVLPYAAVQRSGVPRASLQNYGGLKEEVYLNGFRPAVDARRLLGVADDEVLIVMRPSAEHAHYGNRRGRHLDRALLEHLRRQRDARIVVLPRTARQRTEWAAMANGDQRLIVSRQAIDGPALIAAADLVISSGGTMVREAAVLGVPAISSFTGRIGAVDAFLEREGRIRFVRQIADIAAIGTVARNRDRTARSSDAPLRQIVESICATAG